MIPDDDQGSRPPNWRGTNPRPFHLLPPSPLSKQVEGCFSQRHPLVVLPVGLSWSLALLCGVSFTWTVPRCLGQATEIESHFRIVLNLTLDRRARDLVAGGTFELPWEGVLSSAVQETARAPTQELEGTNPKTGFRYPSLNPTLIAIRVVLQTEHTRRKVRHRPFLKVQAVRRPTNFQTTTHLHSLVELVREIPRHFFPGHLKV